MADVKAQAASTSQFLGLRTDTPASKCPANYSPDCSDMVFSPGGMETRPPFLALLALPAEIVWRKEFTCKDGSIQVLALDIDGVLYTVSATGVVTQIDTVAPGSSVSSVTAYGREYMAFFNESGGCDAPRQWDGKKLYRVSQGGPGAPPTVSNFSIPASSIASGTRQDNEVTIVTQTPHQLLVGYLATIANVNAFIENITSIVVDNETLPGVGVVTTPTAHGLVPGNSIGINNVQPITVAVITAWAVSGNEATITTLHNHGLVVGTTALVEFDALGFSPRVIDSVPSLNSFTFPIATADSSGISGSVMLAWPLASGTLFTINAVPTPTTFQISINVNDSTWNTGSLSFDWDGAFFVESVISPTSFTYRQIGPDGTITISGLETVTPTGQIPAGDHLVCQHFITETGFLSAPSPFTRFTASGGQYIQITSLAIGPSNVVARALSFTGANGSRFFMLLVPGQVNGQQISTSTVINDNTTITAILDFSDVTLLSATGIDIPGNNLFQQTTLNLPRGVWWYENRLYWIGEKNTVIGFQNMGMDGGPALGTNTPLGWNASGVAVNQVGIMDALTGTGTISQHAATAANGTVILQPATNYSLRLWTLGVGTISATISSATTGFSSIAEFPAGIGYIIANFSAMMPSPIPDDMVFSVTIVGATIRDLQMIYADNPNRNPIARACYVQNPEAYDAITGNIGPSDDNTELRAMFVLQESLHLLTERRLYSVQQIGNSEPSSWDPIQISDKCGAFNSNSVETGKGWAAWGGQYGAFWYGGALPDKVSAIIAPTWRKVTTLTNVFDDSDAERVYFGLVNAQGVKSMLVYDYHEVELGGPGKWCPWRTSVNWICDSASGPIFIFGSGFYELGTEKAAADDLGSIGGYYTFSAIALSMFQKIYTYLGLKIAGIGVLTPFLYPTKLSAAPYVLNGQELSTLIDIVAEWPSLSLRGRLLFLKLGQPGVQYQLEESTAVYQADPNSSISGAR